MYFLRSLLINAQISSVANSVIVEIILSSVVNTLKDQTYEHMRSFAMFGGLPI